ncbi:unnamed protein product [Calypogeia fissa]
MRWGGVRGAVEVDGEATASRLGTPRSCAFQLFGTVLAEPFPYPVPSQSRRTILFLPARERGSLVSVRAGFSPRPGAPAAEDLSCPREGEAFACTGHYPDALGASSGFMGGVSWHGPALQDDRALEQRADPGSGCPRGFQGTETSVYEEIRQAATVDARGWPGGCSAAFLTPEPVSSWACREVS